MKNSKIAKWIIAIVIALIVAFPLDILRVLPNNVLGGFLGINFYYRVIPLHGILALVGLSFVFRQLLNLIKNEQLQEDKKD